MKDLDRTNHTAEGILEDSRKIAVPPEVEDRLRKRQFYSVHPPRPHNSGRCPPRRRDFEPQRREARKVINKNFALLASLRFNRPILPLGCHSRST